MGRGRRKHKHSSRLPVARATPDVSTRGILELERFSEVDLTRWDRLSRDLDRLHFLLYFGFAQQRSTLRKELLSALQEPECAPFAFQNWARIIPYRYCLSPLSAEGSLIGVGGRFNVGQDVPAHIIPSWPALYLAEDFETAFREKYGCSRSDVTGSLTPEELALQKPENITSVKLSGSVERAFDLTNPKALKPFCDVLASCKMPKEVSEVLRRLKIDRRKVSVVKTPAQLCTAVMAHNWRQWPVQFEVPGHGQVLASLLVAAGYEAVLYPSSKSDKRCLAIFPSNLGSRETYIELMPDYPQQVEYARLDMDSAPVLSGMAYRT